MMEILQEIVQKHKLKLQKTSKLTGGDINEVYLLETSSGKYVVKIQKPQNLLPKLFEAEAKGLQLLRQSNTFVIPEVIANGTTKAGTYLLLSYIPDSLKDSNFWKVFGQNLAQMHRITAPHFGLDYHNYIGSLPQYNSTCTSAIEFYITQRLEPQLKISKDLGYNIPKLSIFYKNIENEIPNEIPSLIHGDLWNGNYLVAANGLPALIDPAVAFAPREMDLAMMQLFGGFPKETFKAYDSHFPLQEGWKERIPLWQLYYLWVHLNLFGSGYQQSVFRIIKQYS